MSTYVCHGATWTSEGMVCEPRINVPPIAAPATYPDFISFFPFLFAMAVIGLIVILRK